MRLEGSAEGWVEDGECGPWRGQQRPGYYDLCPTYNPRGFRAAAPCFPSTFLFLLLILLGTKKHWAPQKVLIGPGRSSNPKLSFSGTVFGPLYEVFCLSDTMKEEFISHRRLWISGIEALMFRILPWFPHLDPSLQRIGRGKYGVRTEGN